MQITRIAAALVAFLAMIVPVALSPGDAEAAPLRVLLLSGQNNHDWKATTPVLKKIYEASGRFTVDVTEDPSAADAATFAKYDVVVSNWSGFPDMDKRQWGEKAEKAFVDFISGGKGFALFHAAAACLRTWPEFQQLSGACWGNETGHGRIHAFKVTITDRDHPVTRGMQGFFITDELWHRMQAHPARHVLCTAFSAKEQDGTGQDEPVVLATQLGKGRGFNLVLGHDARTMQNAAWQTLMLRGTEWAATGEVTIPVPTAWPTSAAAASATESSAAALAAGVSPEAALKKIAGYKFGQGREDLVVVEKLTYAAAADPALRAKLAGAMAQMLGSDCTSDAKKFLCWELGLVGSADEVPALAALLTDKELATEARAALARIPGDPALAAMRAAAEKASGPVLVGLINTLGENRDAKAVETIAKRLADADVAGAGAAVEALGKIGGPDAVKALAAAKAGLAAELRSLLADAMLRCAEGLLASGRTDDAATIYRELSAPDQPQYVRTAAFPGLVACQKDKAAALLEEALAGKDPALQSAAIRCARRFGDKALTGILAQELPKLSAPLQVEMLGALADRGDPAAIGAVMAAAKSENPAVRLAALAALGALGSADTVGYLAGLAAASTGVDQRTARGSLVRLKGADVEPALIRLAGEGQPPIRREAIAALDGRAARAAMPVMLKAAEDADRPVAQAAARALANLGGAKECAAIIEILKKPTAAAARPDLESAAIVITRRAGAAAETVSAVVAAMAGADAGARASLVRILGRLGGEKALDAVRAALRDSAAEVADAALRALAEWPDGSALPELVAVARAAKDTQGKVLALRGFARLASEVKDRTPEQLAPLFAEAVRLADRPEEKKAVIAAMAKAPCLPTLDLAAASMGEAALKDEAALATVEIAEGVWRYHPAEAKAVVSKVLDAAPAPAVKERATAILIAMAKPVNMAIGATATNPDGLAQDGQASGNAAAIDGDTSTYWDEVDDQKSYCLRVTLKEPAEVSAISIVGFQHHAYAPKDFDIACDDKVVKSVRGAVYDNNRLIVVFPMVKCKALELRITGYYGRSPAIRELEIYRIDPSQVGAAEGQGKK